MKHYKLTVIYKNTHETFEGYAILSVIKAKHFYYYWICGCVVEVEIW